jgi:hypothetical protein
LVFREYRLDVLDIPQRYLRWGDIRGYHWDDHMGSLQSQRESQGVSAHRYVAGRSPIYRNHIDHHHPFALACVFQRMVFMGRCDYFRCLVFYYGPLGVKMFAMTWRLRIKCRPPVAAFRWG